MSEIDTTSRTEVPAIPENPAFFERALMVKEQLSMLTIVTKIDYEVADGYRKESKNAQASIKMLFNDVREWFDRGHKKATQRQAEYLQPHVDNEKKAIELMSVYDREQKRLADLERQRLAAEAAEELRRQQEAKAAELDANGQTEEAVKVLDESIPEVIIAPAKMKPAVSGSSYAITYKARVTDFAALPDAFKLPNQQVLDALAKSNKGRNAPPGVEFYPVESFRGGR